jgi:hypothetical protein
VLGSKTVRDGVVIPPELRALWRQRAEVLATNVASGGREHREIAHAAALIRQDYYDRFLIELLQNANDQALVGGVRDSTVVIVRTERLLAVSNGGQAVTARNLERLSSLADSDKTGVLVGNKGVGFKAVYQVTDAPEVYSASAERAGSVFTDLGVGIALERQPFAHQVLRAAVEKSVAAFFRDNAGLAQALAARGIENPVEAVRPELERVAGFKFPLARDAHDLAARLDELRIPSGEQGVDPHAGRAAPPRPARATTSRAPSTGWWADAKPASPGRPSLRCSSLQACRRSSSSTMRAVRDGRSLARSTPARLPRRRSLSQAQAGLERSTASGCSSVTPWRAPRPRSNSGDRSWRRAS